MASPPISETPGEEPPTVASEAEPQEQVTPPAPDSSVAENDPPPQLESAATVAATVPETTTAADTAVPETTTSADTAVPETTTVEAVPETKTVEKWPGWPGDNVFRLIVPVMKVGSIIGRKGELVKKLCEDTRARVRILEGPADTSDRIVLISGKEDPDAQLSPAMDAVIRVFKRVAGMSPGEDDNTDSAAGAAFCSIRLLVPSSQAVHLIGKQGLTIKSIQEISGASVRVLSEDEVPSYAASNERITEIHGDGSKVLQALEAVLDHLRKFLVDHTVVPIFEKTHIATISQDRSVENWTNISQSGLHPGSAPQSKFGSDFSLSSNRNSLYFDQDTHFDSKVPHTDLQIYGQDHGHGGLRSARLGRTAVPIVTQVTKTMQIPLSYAEDIIGIGGANIAYIRRTSGAILTVQESRGLPDEITVEIKGTSSQVQTAQQLIQDFISSHKEAAPSMYGNMDSGFGSYSNFGDTYSSSSYPSGGYGSSNLGGGYEPSDLGGGYDEYSGLGGGYESSGLRGGGGGYGTSDFGGRYNDYRF